MALTVYGIPTCDTVRKARAWLDRRGAAHGWVDIRATPPSEDRVARWVAAFGVKALQNTSGGSFRALGPKRESWSDARWIAAFASDPMLLKRPIIERNGEPALVGFNFPEAEIAARLWLV